MTAYLVLAIYLAGVVGYFAFFWARSRSPLTVLVAVLWPLVVICFVLFLVGDAIARFQ